MSLLRAHRFVPRMGRLVLVAGVLLGLGVLATTVAPAAHAATATITDCGDDSQLQSAVANAASGDTITFGCSGDIKLTKTLTITQNLTLDGSGQSVTFDGQGSVQVLSVDSGVQFTLNNLTVAHGLASFKAGGLFNNGGTVAITDSTFANNSADVGGGLATVGGTVTITDSTFANNSAGSNSGGLDNDGGTVTISNSTFAGNSSAGERGGGLTNYEGTMTISNSTIANNSAGFGGGVVNFPTSTLRISGSIVADNTATSSTLNNCYNGGTLTDQGYNLESGTDCGFTGTGSLQNTDPQLDPNGLQSNGGPTQTRALQSTSPAIDVIPTASGFCPVTDQRGASRPDDAESACDIGAYESGAILPDHDLELTNVPGDITVNATSPQGAVVTYTPPTVVDEDTPLPPVNCSPASGSTFPIGTTTVTCTASDSGDSNSPVSASFTVTVKGAAAQASDLISLVDSFGLAPDFQASFDTQLQAVQTDLTNNNTTQACNDLAAFSNHVQSQAGKHLTASQASQLLAAATQIGAVLGC